MFSKTIERAEFRQTTQFIFRERDAPLEIVERLEWSLLSLPDEFFGMLLA